MVVDRLFPPSHYGPAAMGTHGLEAAKHSLDPMAAMNGSKSVLLRAAADPHGFHGLSTDAWAPMGPPWRVATQVPQGAHGISDPQALCHPRITASARIKRMSAAVLTKEVQMVTRDERFKDESIAFALATGMVCFGSCDELHEDVERASRRNRWARRKARKDAR